MATVARRRRSIEFPRARARVRGACAEGVGGAGLGNVPAEDPTLRIADDMRVEPRIGSVRAARHRGRVATPALDDVRGAKDAVMASWEGGGGVSWREAALGEAL